MSLRSICFRCSEKWAKVLLHGVVAPLVNCFSRCAALFVPRHYVSPQAMAAFFVPRRRHLNCSLSQYIRYFSYFCVYHHRLQLNGQKMKAQKTVKGVKERNTIMA